LSSLPKTFKAFGWQGPTGQIQRIIPGFIELGWREAEEGEPPTIIYSNDFTTHDAAIELRKKFKSSYLVLNVLDIPEFLLPNRFSLQKAKSQLVEADAVTSISRHTQSQVKKFFNLSSTICYQPMMPVEQVQPLDVPQEVKPYKFISVGRKNDPNKNHVITREIFAYKLLDPNEFADIGPEYGGAGKYMGVVDVTRLSQFYSNARFSFNLGRYEGIGLPILESMSCGCIPLIHHALTTRDEFLPRGIFPEYNYTETTPKSLVKFIKDNEDNEFLRVRLMNYFHGCLKYKFTPKMVATKIIETFEDRKT
jgi:glycosyltransferase involved in cell wall biosynthesis